MENTGAESSGKPVGRLIDKQRKEENDQELKPISTTGEL
jgi:hypothetical protein